MDVREIRSFVVLAEQLHFGNAARALNITQPALTKQIRKLEEEIGGSLFERSLHGTRLTALGMCWLPQARDLLERFEQLATEARRLAEGRAGRLRIGFGFHSLELVPAVVVALRREEGQLELTLRDMSSREQAAALQERQLDIGFLRVPTGLGAAFQELQVVKDRLVLVSPSLAQRTGKLSLEACREQPFVMISRQRSPGFYGHVVRLCAAHGFHPNVVQEVTEFTTALALVRAGMGVTVIPESIVKNNFAGALCHRIADPQAVWKVSAVWRRKDTNPVLQAFLKRLKATVADSGRGLPS